ncbi:hypothetical protein [Peptoniphilus mikwangii]|uniref:hypothetical protein n=1 Tax=Peptoniphilus mikwangii TaxID=1354300 RepID=UPI0004298028|nr:hypothetical protein [Peptoniphilus mikwangii]
MKNLQIYKKNNKIVLLDGTEAEILFDLNKYNDVLENVSNDKYKFFRIIHEEYKISDKKEIESKFLYLFNFILVNNISNYIIDKYNEGENSEIIFEDSIKESGKQIIKLTGKLDTEDVLGDIITCLINSDAYLDGNLKMNYGKINVDTDVNTINRDIEFFFYYIAKESLDLRNKLLEDLIAFKYVKSSKKNDKDRFILPIYVDEEVLKKKGVINYEDYLVNWISLAYLQMLYKIHDYFVDYYGLKFNKGLENDSLMLALIDLLDVEIEDYPKGLNKSIEVGRSTSGKCYFIDSIVTPMALSQDLALILQSKDAFSIVPKIFKSNR